jgi:hypothetical protein
MFYLFLAFLLLLLLVIRRYIVVTLSEEIMSSRGILNLVPITFFTEHREAAEGVIKMMKES